MSRQGQFLTVPCRCSRTHENHSPSSYARNDNAVADEYNFENSPRSRKGCPELNEESWNALSALREKTCRYRSKNMEGNEFDNTSPRFARSRSPSYGGANVLRKANDLIDYVPESEFLRKMKQQCRFLQCNEPNIFSVLDEVTDDKCFDFERPRTTENRYKPPMDETYVKYHYSPQPLPLAKDPPLSYYSKDNENYPPEATGNYPCFCQKHQDQLVEDKKSEHISRNKKRVKGGRRKRKSGSTGTCESEDQFQPSLKKPYENSCPRCWRFASPARSPVNKPDQKFDPNFRRAHSCATFESKMGEDFDDLQVHDQSISPCYRSKSIPSRPSDEKAPTKASIASSGHSPSRLANDGIRFSQPPSASPRAPDLQISPAKTIQDFISARPPSPPRGATNHVAGRLPPKSPQDSSPGRYSATFQAMHDPTQYYSQKSRPDFSPPRAPQEYPPAQTRPKSVHECPQHSSPAKPRADCSPARRSSPPRPAQDASPTRYSSTPKSMHDTSQYSSPPRPRPGSSPPRSTPEVPQYSSPPRSERQNSPPGTIMHEYLPPRCPVHPDVLLHQSSGRQMPSPSQPPSGRQVPEHYATPSMRLPQETTYLLKASPRGSQRAHHHTCPKHTPKMAQFEPMQRPKPQSFIPGGSSTDVNRCYVNVDQQNAASRGMYAPVEKDQCFQLCSNMGPADEDDLDVTEYKTYTPKSTAGKDQGYNDYSQSRDGMMSSFPEECSYSPRRSREGSSGPEARDSTSNEFVKGSGSQGNSKRNSKGSKGSVEFSNVKSLSKSPTNSSPNNLNKSSSSPGSSPSRKKSPAGSQKKGKKSSSSKSGSCKNACGKYTKKGSSPKPSAENRICPPVPSSPKESSYRCSPCSPQCGTKAESSKKRSCSAKRKSPTPSPSKQNKPSSPKPRPSSVQKPTQGRPQSANPATQSSSAFPRERPQTAGSYNQPDSSKSKVKVPDEFYDAGHRVINCTCFPRVQISDPEAQLMCCHCQWQKKESDNDAQDVLDSGTRCSRGVQNSHSIPAGFQGSKIACPYRMYTSRNVDSNLSERMSGVSPMLPTPGQNRSSLEDTSGLSHSRLLREVKECTQIPKRENSATRKYVVFYMTQSKEPKGDDVEVLVEEMSKSCPDKTDERAKDLTEKMRKIQDNPTDSMALRFQKGVAESRTPCSSRILYF